MELYNCGTKEELKLKEIELEKEKEELLKVIGSKEQVIDNIKNLILKGAV